MAGPPAVQEAGRYAFNAARAGSERLFESLPDPESDPSAGSDRDRLAGVRVAPDPRLARFELEGPEAGERDALVRLEAPPDPCEHGLDEEGSLQLGSFQ